MSDPFVAEIRMFPFNFPPKGWAFCNGQLLPLSQNTALFSLLGSTYGGDGKSTFALPDLQGSAPMHQGQGQGLSSRDLGEQAGTEFVTLLESEIPAHTHTARAKNQLGNQQFPANQTWAANSTAKQYINADPTPAVTMAFQALSIAGGSLPHNNLMPYLVVNFCIALQGIFPPRG
jgi:microcystin-dependent protein